MAKTMTVGPKGQVVIPAELRKKLGIEPGDKVTVRLEDGLIQISSRRAAARRLRGKYAHIKVSLSQELHDERREEAEAKGW